ncbi:MULTISPECIES: flagellar basal body P-ring formation chaperone FlgA [Pelosinus]|jgi:flagella basal body P-ring formation protein FlgA|uniref:Flagella basal body P-ring formation protein FlgA n=1 Tax=Pelosinus fermentans B4 TaxID=1149862 RepID=I8RAL7_9FIRM|nr:MULTISPECIES: flagellar basal body P-ring formation chaperone FlgA [Pelosinus]EIW15958.1 flagella basal body P-ring formation protein FlgA [Pelosinus fermentans B4]EIW27336.1 flagella basal body P-ring formation protein FlgA [Pelosinus fermentans A11]OAM92707.1 flagella basal body P-ring formation protein FlgA [Pelosinus fermentans DSM 17108]SDQ54363.1 flagella basal body P-ring formation protein FlgA [Pelosinus fermentans]
MSKKVCLLILFQICVLITSAFAEGTRVVIDEQVRVNGAAISLGQVAKISGDDEKINQELRQLKIGDAPAPGSSFVLTKEIITMRLAAAGIDLASVMWSIPDRVTVIGDSQVISAQTLIDKGINAIRDQVGPNVKYDDLHIFYVGREQEVTAPVGTVALAASLPYGIRYNTPTTIIISVSVDGQAVTKVSLRFKVNLYRQVTVAARQVNAREIFTEDDLRYERMDTGQIAAGFITDKNKILGLMARRLITPGMVISDSMVNKPVIVKRGNMVTLTAFIGTIEVITSGQALQDGYENQLIRVKNISSNKIVFGKVIEENKVQVLTYKSASAS